MNRNSRSLAKPVRRLPLKPETALPALTTLAMVIGSLASGGANANPTGGNVVGGAATIIDRGNGTLDINQSTGKAIINWKDFSIGANETVNFRQPGGKSVTLNRVVGNDPSAIFGKLNANGTVMLVNPNGVVFGKGARIDVGGLVATTANINDKDFLAGNYKFNQASTKAGAAIINEGTISIKDSGLAALVAPSVRNSGVIEAKLGRVALAGAKTFTVDFQGDGLLSFDATSTVNDLPKDANGKPVSALVTNTGTIVADGGTVLMTARAVKGVIDNVVNTDGIISAKTVGTQNGKIVLSGGDAGTVKIAGKVDATGAGAGQQGGKVVVTGEHVDVTAKAAIDVSGAAGGGEIALGSLGVAPDNGSVAFSNKSSTVKVAAGATLKADAQVKGNGGSITMWSNEATAFAGSLSARGGEQGGDGGFAEVSSMKNIGLTGSVDLRAPKGKTGLLLIDPTDLRIVDSNSGGALDGPASDGTISAGDANAANNTVSRGLLESLAGNANIKLEATGQITIADMAAINLKTTSGNSFTLRSTQTGGIRFENSNTEISTQGGAITLEALGVGSTLNNIGKLTSRGGAITLNATGDINLANVIDAGAGAALVRTSAGSIRNTGGANQVVAGGTVTLDASGGSIGEAGNAVNTQTTRLALATGGNLAVANRSVLTSLDVTSRHAQPGVNNTFDITSTGLMFAMADNGGYQLQTVDQSGLNFSFTGDRSITVGNIGVGMGAVSLTSTAGDILARAGANSITAGSLTLKAAGSTGGNGAIGAAGQALNTLTPTVTATSGSGGVYLNNGGSLALRAIDTTGPLSVSTTGNLTLGNIRAGSGSTLTSLVGNIVDDGDDATTINTSSLTLSAETGSIGTVARALKTNASSVSATAGRGGVYLDSTSTNLNITQAQADAAAIVINGAGSVSANNVSSGGGAVNLTGNSIFAGEINAGSGNVTLTARAGSITGNSASLITGNVVTLLAPAANSSYTVGTAGTYLRTAAGELRATGGSIYINQAAGSVLLDDLKAFNGIAVTGVADLTANMLDSGAGPLTLNAQGGSILRANANSELAGSNINLQALQHIGTSGGHIKTATTSLSLTSGGDIYVDNPSKTLTYLSVANSHADPSRRNTLLVSAPFLNFDINDDLGVAYELKQVYSSLLNQFVFRGDQNLKLGNIRGGSSVSLTSTLGSILDDGDINTRVTANNVSLTANQDIGTSANFVAVNATGLTLDTRGNLYATSIADLNSLTVYARHKDVADTYVLDVRAPSLLFNITDTAAGHVINEVRDSNSLNFNFTSDRDITVGSIDAGSGGSIYLNASGAIRDDGNKNTTLLANSINLVAGKAVGATGTGYLDLLTTSLSGTANDGGFFVRLLRPAGSSNTTSIISLNNITATEAVQIDARQGDLLTNGTVRSWNDDVTVNAANGSILSSGGGVYAGGGDILLTATGSIGGLYAGSLRTVGVGGVAGTKVVATAGGDVYMNGTSTDIKLDTVTAGGLLSYTQSSGTTTVGSLQANGSATLVNSSGSILDDGDAATKIQASSISLTAGSVLGAAGAALTLQAPDVTLTSGSNIYVDNLAGLNRLNITRTGTAVGTYSITAPNLSAFTLTDDASGIHLKDLASATNLDFGLSAANKNVYVGNIDAGAGGTVSLLSGASIANDDVASPGAIRAATVSLTAGSNGSIGASGAGGALVLNGTSALNLTAGNSFYVGSDTVLRSVAINSLRSAGQTSTIAITGGAGQVFNITDDGTTQYLQQVSGGLTDFSFSGRKNIQVGALTASNSVSLTTAGGGVYSSITSDTGTGRITSNSLTLSATGSDNYTARDPNTGALGSTSRVLRTSTSNLKITNNGDIFLHNGGLALSSADLYLSRRDAGSSTNFDVNAYSFGGLGGQSLAISGGTSLAVGANMSGASLSINADSAIVSNTINTGATGSVTLTSRYANTSFAPTISGSGLITGNNVSLNALTTNGSVSAQTSANNLSIGSAGNVAVANNKALTSLALTANHASTSGSIANSYSISASGLTFSVSDSTGTAGLTLNNVTSTGNLALSLSSDRTLTVNNVTTAAGGSVTLSSNGNIYGNSSSASSPNITTGALTLNAGSVTGTYLTNQPLYTSVDSLSSNIRGSLWLSNNKTLTLNNNSAASSAQVNVTNGSILQDTGTFVAPSLTLTATQSIGAAGNAVQTDTRMLTTQTGKDLYLNNASDLFSLNVRATHANAALDNVLQVAAKGLTFDVTDSGVYSLNNVRDVTGVNFTFSGDRTIYIGNIDTGPAQNVSISAEGSGSNILNLTPTSHITGDSVQLFATGQIGVASGDNSGSIHTTTSELYLTGGSHMYVDNDRDLASLSLYATGGNASTYQIRSNELLFDVAHNGSRLLVNEVRDNTGLNLSVSSSVGQDIGIIDTTPTGTVRLSSNNSILGSADDTQRITASQVSITTQGAGGIGAVGREINLSAPIVNIQNAGDVYIDSDTHIDSLSLYSTGNGARNYAINSPTRDGGNIGFIATDGGSGSTAGLVLTNITDTGGLNLSVTSDRTITAGTINVGFDNVSLTSRLGSLLGDGDATTKIDAASLSLTANNAIGAAGTGNAIDTRVSTLNGRASNGGAFITVEGNTSLPSLTSTGASSVSNTVGDIELGSVNTNGNAFTVNNTGGSILSGTISNATTVNLTANGSIGNKSAIRTTNISGGTTIVTLSANKTATADGSIALIETYGLRAASVTADGNITLTSDTGNGARDLVVGTISTTGGAVSLSANYGNIVGADNSNRITGNSVTLTATQGTNRTLGTSGTRLHLDTPSLTLNTPGSIYVDNLADLTDLTINRANGQGSQLGSAGALSISAQNLTFSGTDSGNVTTLTTVRDTTGLNFTYQAIGAINLNQIDVTQNGSVNLSTNPYYYTGGAIQGVNNSSKITAGDLTLSTSSGDTTNSIGSSSRALNTQVKNISATASGGIWLSQTGSINLGNLRAGEDLSVTTTTGDILVGSVSYGTNKTLTLNAQTGSILDGGGVISGSGNGAISLTARNGIGTNDAAIKISAPNNPVSATVTGAGSLFLDSTNNLLGGLTTSVANGETRVTSSGNIVLTSMTSGTDATGNGISVKTTSGNITVKNVQAGTTQGQITLNAENGYILADAAGATIKAYGVALNARSGIGANSTLGRINATGQRVEATTNGAMYLAADNNSVYSYLSGNVIDIAAAGNLQIANAIAANGNGTIRIVGNGTNSQLVAGNIDAGAGSVNIDYSKAGSTIVDDREESTRIIGNFVTLKAAAGIGGAEGSADNVQTTAASITAEVTGNGAIYLDDNRAAGTTLSSIITNNGAIGITTAGNTVVSSAITKTSSANNDISIATSNGDLYINTIDAMPLGDVTLSATGSILGALSANLIYGNSLTATAGGSIGSATNLADGSGGIALRTNLASLGNLSTGADGAVIVLNNVGTRALTLNGNVTQTGDNSSVYLRSSGDLDARSGLANTADNVLLSSGGLLTVASAGVQANDTVTLIGSRDVVAAGATPRTITVNGDTLNFSSGSAGGNTVLTTQVANANASLTGITAPANLTLNNTGDLTAALYTANGNIKAKTTGALDVSATADGNNRTIDLTAEQGDLSFGLINAGAANGAVILSAADGSLLGQGTDLIANSLDLTSKNGIGAANSPFMISARNLTANVLGAGDINVQGISALTLGQIATTDGSIKIKSFSNLVSGTKLSAGNGGDVLLGSTAGNVTVSHAIASGDASNLTVDGLQITVAAVDTTGAQTYNGNVVLNGDLTGTSININGGAQLAGGKRTLTANGASGGVSITGALNGGAQQAVIVAQDGDVTLGDNATNLASLTIDGANIDLHQVATTGAQQYNGNTTLRGTYTTTNGAFGVDGVTTLDNAVNVATGNGAVTFTGDVNGLNALTVTSSGGTTYGGAVNIGSLNQAGTGVVALNGGGVNTLGMQNYAGRVLLGDDTTLTGSTISLGNGADGAYALDINGAATLAGAIGANTKLASLTLNGTATLNTSSIATTGNQHYTQVVTLGSNQSLSTTTGDVTFDNALEGAGRNVAINSASGGDVSLNTVGNANQRLGSITINTAGETSFNGEVYAASVQTDAPGTVAINASRIDTTGTQSYGELVTLGNNATLKGSTITLSQGMNAADESLGLTIDGNAVIDGAVGAGVDGRLAGLVINGTAQLAGGVINTVGAQAYQGNVTLADDLVIRTGGAAGSNVSFNGTVASSTGEANDLTINAGLGNVTLARQVGDAAGARLGALAINSDGTTQLDGAVYAASVTTDAGGTLALNGSLVDTSGTQSYGELAVLGANTVLKGSTVTLAQGADSVDETQGLTIDGNAVVNGALGAGEDARLASLTITGAANLNGGLIDTVGAQSYQGNVTLSDDLDIQTANANVTFGAAVASAAGAANALTVNAGSGNVNVVGAMGDAATARLGDVRVNSSGATTLGGAVYAASVTTDAGGTLAINGGRVDTTGTQSYGELAVLGADTVLKGSSITLAQGANGTDETQDLTIDGDAVINGAVGVGANARLASLTVTGKSGLAGGTINTVGAQSYQGDVTLSDDLVVNTSGAAGSNVSFGGAVASSAGDANALTINAGLGNVTLAGQVGDAADARLGALAINSNGATKLDGAVYAASVTTDAGGTLAINGGLVDTTGTQTYGELAVLGADTVLKGSTVTLAQGADSVDETQGLTIDGNAVVNGALGGGNDARLASLTITGDAELGGGTINTVGAQSYQGNVTLTDDLDSQSANGDVTFGGTLVSSAQDGHGLSLATGTGNVTFSGAVGDDADGRLGDISIASNGATTLNGPVYAASISSDVGGTLAINGGLVDTTGTQTYGELAVLGGDTVLKGSTVSLLGGGDGKHDLTIDGDAVLKGTFGGQDALASLTITGKSTLDGNIATTGDQTYQGEVTLDGDVTLGTQGGNVAFNDKLASSQGDGHGLSLNTGSGDVTFSGPVGDDADGRLGDITIASNGATTLNGPVYAASISSDVGGTLAINGGLVDTTGTQSYGERAVLGGDTVLKGSTVSLLGGGDGEHDLTIDGDAVLKGPFGAQEALASLTVTGKSTLGEGSINTTGDQSYQGAVTLDGNVVIATRDGDIGFDDSVDGSHDLTVSAGQGDVTFSGPVGQDSRLGNLVIAAAGDTVLDGPVRAGTLQTSGNGDLLINGGSIDTTGTQQYGQHIILGALDTTLTGTNVQIQAGVDGTNPGEQGLVIAGNADIQGDVGGTTPLRGLAIDGTTTMGPGKVNTTGDQVYTGAVTLTGDRELTSSTGSIIMGSTLDGGNGNNLAINAGKNVQVAGDATGLGALTLRAVDTIVFNGDVSAYRVQQLEAKSASYNGAVRATGPDGIDISGGSVSFGKDVTADTGPIRINNTDPAGTTTFAAGTTVKAATGFTQTGGAGLTLPAQLLVTQGPISLGAPAKLQGANATISTNGDITAVGLSGPQTSLTLASGPLGALRIGLNDADPSHKLDVAELIVPTAGSADLWGTIGGKTGPLAAASIKSSLVGSPFYLNGFTWGPTDTVNRLSAITAPRWVIPSTPTADSLFRGTVPSDGFGPNPLGAYSDPQVLKVVASNFAWQFMNGGDNTSLAVPSSNGPVLQTPGSNSQKPVVEGTQSSDDERRDNDAQSRTL